LEEGERAECEERRRMVQDIRRKVRIEENERETVRQEIEYKKKKKMIALN
jgi:hypothetical protein